MTARIIVEQDAPTRITLSIQGELWDGFGEIGRIEVDVAKYLDPLSRSRCSSSTD